MRLRFGCDREFSTGVQIRGLARARAVCVAAGLAASIGVCGQALAQDSTSIGGGLNGLPGDAPSAFSTTQQSLRYVVDLTPKSTSLLNRFAIGPIIKSSRSNAGGYFDQLIAGQTASNRFAPIGAFASPGMYSLWTNTPGAGVNAGFNSAPASTIDGATNFGQGFGVGFLEFGAGVDGQYTTGDDENAIISGLVNVQFKDPNRVFVLRTVAALSKTSGTGGNSTAAFGLGSVDERGSMHIYGDDYALLSTSRLAQRNAIRVNALSRNTAALNSVFQAGASPSSGDAAATSFVRTQPASMAVPAMIARSASGALDRPVLITTDLASNLIIETSAGATTSIAPAIYLPAGSSGPRGSVAFIPQAFAPTNGSGTALGTAATLCRTDSNTKTRGVSIFGISSSLAVDTKLALELPVISASITDPVDGFAPGASFGPVAQHEFTNYASQATFRGSSSQVAMTVLPSGQMVVAALVAATGGGSSVPQGQENYIAVATIPAAGGTPTWTIGAYAGETTTPGVFVGKAILGRTSVGGPTTVIGRLARYTEAFGTASTGPSISSPAIDRSGNLYFTAAVALDNPLGGTTYSTALLKATRDASGGYTLEVIAKPGDVVAGGNSGRNYQIQYLGVADADSVDSGAIFSTNIVQDHVAGVNASTVQASSPSSLGALAFRAKIVYDVNNDGSFVDPSGSGSGSTSPDEAYNAVMLLMPRIVGADFNRDGVINIDDIFIYLNVWFAGGVGSDWNGNGIANIDDIFIYLNAWFAGGV